MPPKSKDASDAKPLTYGPAPPREPVDETDVQFLMDYSAMRTKVLDALARNDLGFFNKHLKHLRYFWVHGKTVLHLAAEDGRHDLVRLCIEHRVGDKGVDVPTTSTFASPLICAAGLPSQVGHQNPLILRRYEDVKVWVNDSPECALTLLGAGARATRTDIHGWTALHWAVSSARVETSRALLTWPYDSNSGITPAELLSASAILDMVAIAEVGSEDAGTSPRAKVSMNPVELARWLSTFWGVRHPCLDLFEAVLRGESVPMTPGVASGGVGVVWGNRAPPVKHLLTSLANVIDGSAFPIPSALSEPQSRRAFLSRLETALVRDSVWDFMEVFEVFSAVADWSSQASWPEIAYSSKVIPMVDHLFMVTAFGKGLLQSVDIGDVLQHAADGRTILHLLAELGDYTSMLRINSAIESAPERMAFLLARTGRGETALHAAARGPEKTIVLTLKTLVNMGVPVDAARDDGVTALSLLASLGRQSAVEYLIGEAGADPSIPACINANGREFELYTAADLATASKKPFLADFITREGSAVRGALQFPPTIWSLLRHENPRRDLLRLVDILSKGPDGCTALRLAVHEHNYKWSLVLVTRIVPVTPEDNPDVVPTLLHEILIPVRKGLMRRTRLSDEDPNQLRFDMVRLVLREDIMPPGTINNPIPASLFKSRPTAAHLAILLGAADVLEHMANRRDFDVMVTDVNGAGLLDTVRMCEQKKQSSPEVIERMKRVIIFRAASDKAFVMRAELQVPVFPVGTSATMKLADLPTVVVFLTMLMAEPILGLEEAAKTNFVPETQDQIVISELVLACRDWIQKQQDSAVAKVVRGYESQLTEKLSVIARLTEESLLADSAPKKTKSAPDTAVKDLRRQVEQLQKRASKAESEVSEWRVKAEEAKRQVEEGKRLAEEAKRVGDELRRAKEEMKRVSEAARRQVEQAEQETEAARRRIVDMQRQMDEAKRQTQEARRQTDEAKRQMDEAKRQVVDVEKRVTEEAKRQVEDMQLRVDEAKRLVDKFQKVEEDKRVKGESTVVVVVDCAQMLKEAVGLMREKVVVGMERLIAVPTPEALLSFLSEGSTVCVAAYVVNADGSALAWANAGFVISSNSFADTVAHVCDTFDATVGLQLVCPPVKGHAWASRLQKVWAVFGDEGLADGHVPVSRACRFQPVYDSRAPAPTSFHDSMVEAMHSILKERNGISSVEFERAFSHRHHGMSLPAHWEHHGRTIAWHEALESIPGFYRKTSDRGVVQYFVRKL